MIQVLARVLENSEITGGGFLLRLAAPEIASRARPGQFVHLRVMSGTAADTWDPLLRRPLGILWARADAGEIACFYDVVGRGTSSLTRLRVGDSADVLGPLGKGFELAGITRHALLIGGGIGIVPLVALAETALRDGVVVTLAAGFRSVDRVFPASLLPPEVEYLVATDDGTRGYSGFVTELARPLIPWADQVFACGPTPMLKSTARLGARRELVQLSLEERMACGMGVCLGCVVPTRHGLRRVCRDGPVFQLSDLDW